MSELVFLLEEPSARAMLEGFLPKILPKGAVCRYIVFEGKQDLEKQMVKRLRGYRVPKARFIVLRDQDSADCHQVKQRLVAKCCEAQRSQTLVRLACHELESWYLGDLAAVELGLGSRGLSRNQNKRPFHSPDNIAAPVHKLRSIAPAYQKIAGSRAIGPHLDPEKNRSHSFGVFVAGLRKLVGS